MKLVGITQRVDYIADYMETRDALDQRWHKFLTLCGLTVILLPNNREQTTSLVNHLKLKGVIISGGNLTPERNEVEQLLINQAYQYKFPLIGVCNGMQQIQRHAGLTLQEVQGHIAKQQQIIVDDNERNVNSYHNYGTTQTTADLHVWAKAPDGVIKAIRHYLLPIVGIMWHPERADPFDHQDIKLFKQVFNGAS